MLQLDRASGVQSGTLVSNLILLHPRIQCWITHLRAMFWIVILPLKNFMKLILLNKCQTSYWNIPDPLPSEWNQWNIFFSFSFLLQFFWLLFFIQLLICFRIPKTLSSAWTCPQFNLRCEYYPPSCLFFTSTWSMTPFPTLISVEENLHFFFISLQPVAYYHTQHFCMIS